ncbi:MAG: hypothetical protein JWO83_888 [Caulobacteraceae bacterium]|nr:hypothetical protein [Caulobacteraceae bacterium]
MDTALSETQELIRASIRDYLRREITFDRIRELESNGGYDEALWLHLGRSGFLALPFASPIGGGAGLVELGILVEELTRRASVAPLIETLTCAMCVERFGDPGLAGEIIPQVVSGGMRISPALLERDDRYDHAMLPFDGGAISGTKCFVDYAPSATHYLVSALDGGELVLALAEANPDNATLRMLDNISRLPQANVTFSRTPVRRVAGAEALHWLVGVNRVLSAVQRLGAAQQALEMTVDYVKAREQFGQPIGAFQAVQHHCANMATMVEACRFLTYECLWQMDEGAMDDRLVATAKNWAARTVTEVTMLAHELHGGIGVTEEYDLHFFTRRGKDRAVAWGSADETLRYLADTVGQQNSWH